MQMYRSHLNLRRSVNQPGDGRVRRRVSLVRAGVGCSKTLNPAKLHKEFDGEFIREPHENDILLGRGGNNNRHSGNERLRDMARQGAVLYNISTKKQKSAMSRQLVHQMRSLDPPARFLKRIKGFGWKDVGDFLSREKASQVLRDAVQAMQEEEKHIRSPPKTSSIPIPVPVSSSPHRRYDGRFMEHAVAERSHKRRRHGESLPDVHDSQDRTLWRPSPSFPVEVSNLFSSNAPSEQASPRPTPNRAAARPLPLARRRSSMPSQASHIDSFRVTNGLDFDLFNGELLESDSEARMGPPTASRSESPNVGF